MRDGRTHSRRVAWGIVLLALVAGQARGAVTAEPRLVFDHITIDQGLPQNTVRALLLDRRGFLWAGTEDGLGRYYGFNFTTFRHDPADERSIADNFVWCLLEDRQGRLWVGTNEGGLDRFDRTTGRFVHHRHDPGDPNTLSGNNVRCLLQDRAGNLWAGTHDHGLNRISPDGRRVTRFRHVPGDPGSLGHDRVLSLAEDSSGTLWVGTQNGLDRFDPKAGRFKRYAVSPGNPGGLSNNTIQTILADGANGLWVGTTAGLNRYDRPSDSFFSCRTGPSSLAALANANVVTSYRDPRGTLWFGTIEGLYRVDPVENWTIRYRHDTRDRDSLAGDIILALLEDPCGNFWVGTAGEGLDKFSRGRQKFPHYRPDPELSGGLTHGIIRAVHEDRSGRIWIGTLGGGIFSFDRLTGKFQRFSHEAGNSASLSDDHVTSILEDRAGDLWVGTWNGGLNRWRGDRGRLTNYRHSDADGGTLSSDTVQSIYQDRQGTIWIGTDGGLNRFDPATETFTRFVHDPATPGSISDNRVQSTAIHEDQSGRLWIGTWRGLNRFDRRTGHFARYLNVPAAPRSLSDNRVLTIHEDPRGMLWLGTYGGGLNRFDPATGKCTVFKEAQGLPNNVVYGIQPDNRGNLWLSTNRGLSLLDPVTLTFRNYDIDDGLQSNQFFWGASWRCRNGQLIFGGINGFNLFSPEHILDSPFNPPLVLTNFKVLNEPYPLETDIPETQRIRLSHRENFIAFEFAALDFTEPRKNKYAYRLEGLNPGWIEVGNDHQASYTNLDPGEYLFRVKGTNSDGVWNEAGLAVQVSIVPPPWKTWWAYLAYALTIVVGLAAFYRIKSRSQRLKSERQMAEQLRDLNLALTSTLDIDQVTARLLDNLVRTVPFDSGLALVIVDGQLSVRARRGEEGPPTAGNWNSAFIREGLFAELSRTRMPMAVADIRPDKRFDWASAGGAYRSWLGIPLVYRDRVIGAVSLFGRLPGAFGGREADIASAFAAQAGIAIENARLFSEVKNLAVTDELTGLFNRRHFFEVAENEYRRVQRYGRPLSAIMVDIDHFKKLNDTYGHPFGDQVLRHVGQFFRRNLWETDIVGRYGGEEFLVLLTETDLPEALLVAERLRRRFAEGAMPSEQLGPLAVTVSLGVSTLAEEDEGLEALFARADAAMYQAKRRGRDKVVSVRRDLVFQEMSQSGNWVSIHPDETGPENQS